MIRINQRFSTERDAYQWLLHESKAGLSKKKIPIVVVSTTYHPNLKSICREIANRDLGKCESVDDIFDALSAFERSLDGIFRTEMSKRDSANGDQ